MRLKALSIVCISSALACSPTAWAEPMTREQCDREYGVRIGHEGKDVIWVPTHPKLAVAMLEAANTTAEDYVVDLGAGDGRVPLAAAKLFRARALGIELDARMVDLARCYAAADGVDNLVEIRQADIFETDFSAATVLTLYLLPKLNLRLRPTILAMKPGTRVISNRFPMGKWRPDRIITVEGVANQALLWIVPAPVAGRWRIEQVGGAQRFNVRFKQRFQQIDGELVSGAGRVHAERLEGAHIQFSLTRNKRTALLTGTVEGASMRLLMHEAGSQAEYLAIKY